MLTMKDPLEQARRLHAGRTAVIDGERRFTYAELHDRARRLGAGLRGLGVGPGERVAILAANGHRYVEAFFGVPASGRVFVPLNTRLAERELVAILQDCRPSALLCDRDPGALATQVARVVSIPDEYDSLLDSASPEPLPSVRSDALAALFYTGGTTGASKGVMLTHGNLVANAIHKIIACSLQGDDRFLAFAAMFHVAGIAPMASLVWLGATTVTMPAFDPDACLDAIERQRVTLVMPVPTMLAALAASQSKRPRDVRSLRMIGHAGSSITNATIEAAHAAFPDTELAQFYGATETASIVTCLRNEQALIGTPRLGSCGRATPGVAVRVLRDDGVECEPGEVGEIAVRGPNVMAGYWNKPEATRSVLAGGWYRSGDLGSLGDDGYLFIVDRKKDMIITGAENVYSIEVEDALGKHAAVIEAAVYGVPDPVWGEAVHATVVVAEARLGDAESLAEELRAHCRQFIAGYKVPKRIDVQTTPLPKSGPGKILKRSLREKNSYAPGAAGGPAIATGRQP